MILRRPHVERVVEPRRLVGRRRRIVPARESGRIFREGKQGGQTVGRGPTQGCDTPRDASGPLHARRAKAALALGNCPECSKVLEVVDTWERSCADPACGYTYHYYEWPWVTAELPPRHNESG